eukprot:g20486.t1
MLTMLFQVNVAYNSDDYSIGSKTNVCPGPADLNVSTPICRNVVFAHSSSPIITRILLSDGRDLMEPRGSYELEFGRE